MKFSMDSALSRRMPTLFTESGRGTDIVKLKGTGRNGGQILSCSIENYFCLFTI